MLLLQMGLLAFVLTDAAVQEVGALQKISVKSLSFDWAAALIPKSMSCHINVHRVMSDATMFLRPPLHTAPAAILIMIIAVSHQVNSDLWQNSSRFSS